MRLAVFLLMLLTGCATTRREDEHFEHLFNERAIEGGQFEPYQPHDAELWHQAGEPPQPFDHLITRYFVPADEQGFTPGEQAP